MRRDCAAGGPAMQGRGFGRRQALTIPAALAAPGLARAQARTVRLIVPYGAGNVSDQVARLLATGALVGAAAFFDGGDWAGRSTKISMGTT